MWRPAVPVAPVAGPLVSFDSAAAELRLEEAGEITAARTRVEGYLRAAEGHVQRVTGLQLADQALTLRATDWSDLDTLPVGPVSDVASVEYVDAAGVTQTLDPGDYEVLLDSLAAGIALAGGVSSWPARQTGSLITVTLTAGYGADESAAPGEIVTSVLLLVRGLNDDGNFDAVAGAVDSLLTNYRLHTA